MGPGARMGVWGSASTLAPWFLAKWFSAVSNQMKQLGVGGSDCGPKRLAKGAHLGHKVG